MNISIMAYSFQRALASGELDLLAVIRFAGNLGVHELELMDAAVRPEQVPTIQARLKELGITVICYDVVCDVVTADAVERQARLVTFKHKLGQAAALGAKLVMVVPGLNHAGFADAVARQWFCKALRAALPEASRLGLTLTIENLGVMATVYGRSDQLLAICEAVGPELRVTYDAGNFLLAGEESLQAFDRLAERVVHVHVKDWRVVPEGTTDAYPGIDGRWFQGAALGEGVVNLRGVIAQLQRRGYRGALSVEYEGSDEPRAAVRRGVAFLRPLLGATSTADLTNHS